MLYAPSISDDDAPTSERYTRWSEFVPALLDELEAIGYVAALRPGVVAPQLHGRREAADAHPQPGIRGAAEGPLGRHVEGAAPTVYVTEGGARLSRMPRLYPGEDPRRRRRSACATPGRCTSAPDGAGAGVAMFAQYLLYADPNFDCGLLDPYPSTVKRPAYEAWRAFPVYA